MELRLGEQVPVSRPVWKVELSGLSPNRGRCPPLQCRPRPSGQGAPLQAAGDRGARFPVGLHEQLVRRPWGSGDGAPPSPSPPPLAFQAVVGTTAALIWELGASLLPPPPVSTPEAPLLLFIFTSPPSLPPAPLSLPQSQRGST